MRLPSDLPHSPTLERMRRLIAMLAPILIVLGGIVLALISLIPSVEVVGEDVLDGTAPPGNTLRTLTPVDYGAAVFSADVLPCPLLIFLLTDADHSAFLVDSSLPQRLVDCDNPSITVGQQVSHLLLRNVDPTDSMNYTLRATFYRSTQPSAWLSLPAFGLLLGGSAIIIIRLLLRGIERASK